MICYNEIQENNALGRLLQLTNDELLDYTTLEEDICKEE